MVLDILCVKMGPERRRETASSESFSIQSLTMKSLLFVLLVKASLQGMVGKILTEKVSRVNEGPRPDVERWPDEPASAGCGGIAI
jgi:hypothetical protein